MDNIVYGAFTSKRGIDYDYIIHLDNSIEVFKPAKVVHRKGVGGYTMGHETFIYNPSKEIVAHIEKKHGIKVNLR